MLSDADRADARTAATMRDAEGFVEIQMANIGSKISGAAETNLRIHIRTVHVNLTTSSVDEIANIADAFLENTVSRGIGDHDGSEIVAVEVGLGAEVGEINVAVGVTTCIPTITALAGFVPCAEVGMRQTERWASPREWW